MLRDRMLQPIWVLSSSTLSGSAPAWLVVVNTKVTSSSKWGCPRTLHISGTGPLNQTKTSSDSLCRRSTREAVTKDHCKVIVVPQLCSLRVKLTSNDLVTSQKRAQQIAPANFHHRRTLVEFKTMKWSWTVASYAIVMLSSLGTLVPALPHLQRRGLPGAVYICDGTQFRGNCGWIPPSNRCVQQGGAGRGTESIGPDPGGFCTLYEKFDCTGTKIQTVRFPGILSDLPQFGALRCFADTTVAQENKDGAVGAAPASTKETLDPFADPRLAGGVGSADRKKNIEEISQMEKDGFRDGLIGLKKGVYY